MNYSRRHDPQDAHRRVGHTAGLFAAALACVVAESGFPSQTFAEGPAPHEAAVSSPNASNQPAPQGAQPPAPIAPQAEQQPYPYLFGDWLGTRRKLADDGISFDIGYTADYTHVFSGGLDPSGSRWRRLLDLGLTFDPAPLFHVQGGAFFVDFQNAVGPDASDTLTGDVQGFDGLDGVPETPHQNRTQLSQIWYQQTALNGALRVKVGKMDANTDFDHSDVASNFLQQSYGASATLFALPTYPDAAFGASVFLKANENLQLSFGVFDGSLGNGVTTGSLGPRTFFRNPKDLFLIGEIDQAWTLGPNNLPGRLAAGLGYSTNEFLRIDGKATSGFAAPYLLLDQALWRASPGLASDARGLDAFIMYGYGDPSVIAFDYNIGGGVAWTGPIPGRSADIFGIGAQAVHFGRDVQPTEQFEVDYEVFYRAQIISGLAIKPDLQYISNPGGQHTPDALAATIRFEVHF